MHTHMVEHLCTDPRLCTDFILGAAGTFLCIWKNTCEKNLRSKLNIFLLSTFSCHTGDLSR